MSLLTRAVGVFSNSGNGVSAENDPSFHELRHELDRVSEEAAPVDGIRTAFVRWEERFKETHGEPTLEESEWFDVLGALLDGRTRSVYDVLGILEQSSLWAGHTIPLLAENMPSNHVDTALLAPLNFTLKRLPFGRYLMRAAKVANLGRVLFREVHPSDLKEVSKAVAAKLTEKRLTPPAEAP